jgi:hypothetical protein
MIDPKYTIFKGYPGWDGYTGTRRIGYVGGIDSSIGFSNLPITSPFSPSISTSGQEGATGPLNPIVATGTSRPFSASFTHIISCITKYLVTDLQCDSIILDVRGAIANVGFEGQELSEFFGADRYGIKTFLRRPDSGFSQIIDPDLYQWPLNAFKTMSDISQNFSVSTNVANYPESVFRGVGNSYTGARKVVICTSDYALSNMSRFQRLWYGNNKNKNIGSNTISKLIGSTCNRYGGQTNGQATALFDEQIPFGSSYIATAQPFTYAFEQPSYGMMVSYVPTGSTGGIWYQKEYPGITNVDRPKNGYIGTAVYGATGTVLPGDLQSTLYPDWGAYPEAFAEQNTKFPNLYLPEKTEDNTTKGYPTPQLNNMLTWRDSWLETAIYEGMVPVLPGENGTSLT